MSGEREFIPSVRAMAEPGDGEPRRKGDVAVKERPKTKKPRLYRVLMHNDDYTTQEFVVEVLRRVFAYNTAQAVQLMLLVHKSGLGVVGVYTREIAETKVNQTTQLARNHGHPLKCTMEPES